MTNQGAIFIRTSSIYQDCVAQSMEEYTKNPVTVITYEGQKHGIEDFKLISLINRKKPIHVFARGINAKSYVYLGQSINCNITKERSVPVGTPALTNNQRLQIQILLPIIEPQEVPHDIEFAESNPYAAKYKHDCLAYVGARNYVTGSPTSEGTFCSKNLLVGFFGW